MLEGLLGFAAMFVLMLLRVPIAIAMAAVGVIGLGLMRSWPAAFSSAATEVLDIGAYTLSVVPLFVLMGNFVTRAGMSRELYQAAYAFIGHRRAGLSMSTIVACAGFGAICGSSIATTATMARVSMPEMRRFNYEPSFAAGSICAGGTLGILIPPSVILVIYGIMTESSIGALFAAGVVPGLIAVGFYIAASVAITAKNPHYGPPGDRTQWPERWQALKQVWGVLVLFLLVIGGMYGGFFTPTEAAGVGAFGGFLFALLRRQLPFKALVHVLVESARTTAMLFTIVIGAAVFANFLNFTSLPTDLRGFVTSFDVSPVTVIVAICLIYDRPFFKDLVSFMISGPVCIQVLEGDNAIQKNRDLMGATDPKKAAKGTIRADFAESIDANAVHGSDSPETAAVEIAYFFPSMDIYTR